MATNFSTDTIGDSTTTASIRSWAQFVEDTLVTVGGWTPTNDTGQTMPSDLPAATVNSQKCGFRIYNMADTLQGEYPVFVRIDYGSGVLLGAGNTAPPYSPGLWLTIGTGSTGSGGITGAMLSNAQVSGFDGGGGAQQSFGSADKGRCTFAMFVPVSNISEQSIVFGIERWKDFTGADTGGGLMLVYSAPIGISGGVQIAMSFSPCLAFGAVSQQPIDLGLSYVHTTNDPSPTNFGDRGLGVLFHFRGTVIQPGTNFLICNQSDIADNAYVFVNIYGRQQTYQNVPQVFPVVGAIAAVGFGPTFAADTYRKVLMRFD